MGCCAVPWEQREQLLGQSQEQLSCWARPGLDLDKLCDPGCPSDPDPADLPLLWLGGEDPTALLLRGCRELLAGGPRDLETFRPLDPSNSPDFSSVMEDSLPCFPPMCHLTTGTSQCGTPGQLWKEETTTGGWTISHISRWDPGPVLTHGPAWGPQREMSKP